MHFINCFVYNNFLFPYRVCGNIIAIHFIKKLFAVRSIHNIDIEVHERTLWSVECFLMDFLTLIDFHNLIIHWMLNFIWTKWLENLNRPKTGNLWGTYTLQLFFVLKYENENLQRFHESLSRAIKIKTIGSSCPMGKYTKLEVIWHFFTQSFIQSESTYLIFRVYKCTFNNVWYVYHLSLLYLKCYSWFIQLLLYKINCYNLMMWSHFLTKSFVLII